MIKPIVTNIKELKLPNFAWEFLPSENIIELLDDLDFTLSNNGKGVGLAAPQIGIHFKVAIVRSLVGNIYLINPKIIEKNNKKVCVEGCLSLPGIQLAVDRWNYIKFENYTKEGKLEIKEADGVFAEIIQHELDHCNGILITDRKHSRR